METKPKTRRTSAIAFITAGALSVLAGCGGDDFKREATPSLPVELTGVIQPGKVTISPKRVGAGPVAILISNQTNDAHTVTLEGSRIRARVGPIQPQDTATIQEDLKPGSYEVRAGSPVATPRPIAPGQLIVGRRRGDASGQLQTP